MFHDFITSHSEEILSRAATVTARQRPAMSSGDQDHGLPAFLTQLAETLRLGAPNLSLPAIAITAGRHGSELVARRFTVAQVVHEYSDLCRTLTVAALQNGVAIGSDDFQTLNLCLDLAIENAVTEFSRERERALEEGESERLGHLTHELRNLLSAATLSFQAVKSGKIAVGGSTAAILDRSLKGMRDLLDATISEVRLSAGTHDAKRISVSQFLRDVEGVASLQAAQREMNVDFAVLPVDVLVSTDPQLLSSALFNLLQNAFKYSVPHAHVAVRPLCVDERVSIEVEDECGGLPEQEAEAFFSPFGSRRGRDRSGLGLGLSISRKAVRALGGDISFRNLPGKGCIFAIDLPIAT